MAPTGLLNAEVGSLSAVASPDFRLKDERRHLEGREGVGQGPEWVCCSGMGEKTPLSPESAQPAWEWARYRLLSRCWVKVWREFFIQAGRVVFRYGLELGSADSFSATGLIRGAPGPG